MNQYLNEMADLDEADVESKSTSRSISVKRAASGTYGRHEGTLLLLALFKDSILVCVKGQFECSRLRGLSWLHMAGEAHW